MACSNCYHCQGRDDLKAAEQSYRNQVASLMESLAEMKASRDHWWSELRKADSAIAAAREEGREEGRADGFAEAIEAAAKACAARHDINRDKLKAWAQGGNDRMETACEARMNEDDALLTIINSLAPATTKEPK